MTRTILAIATALFAIVTVFASAAEACISCEHVPVVARSSSTSYGVKSYKKRRSHARARVKARARAIAAARAKAKARAIAAARAKAKAKAIAAAEAAAAKKVELAEATDNENSTISTASLDNDEIFETEVEAKDEPKASSNVGCKKFFPTVGKTLTVPCENSTISTASLDNGEIVETEVKASDEPETTKSLSCKKFFPSVGMTLTVPCE